MNGKPVFVQTIVYVVVVACWVAFAGLFVFRHQTPKLPDKKRAPASIYGLVLQCVSYPLLWLFARDNFSPLFPQTSLLSLFSGILAMAVAVTSIFIVITAVRTLGKEWSVTARVVEGHKLATTGPYRFVRHPIYTGMLGMLLATGLAVSTLFGILSATIVFFAGTVIRMRSEERLLHETFGAEFDDYSHKVSAIIPGLY